MWKPFEIFEKNSYPLIILPNKIMAILNEYPPLKSKYPYFLQKKPQREPLIVKSIIIIALPIMVGLFFFEKVSLLFTLGVFTVLPILLILELRANKKNFNKKIFKYEADLQKYEKQLEVYNTEVEEKHNDLYMWLYQSYFIREFLNSVKKPNIAYSNRKGASEQHFGLTLNYWFPNKIFTNYAFEAPSGIRPFAPDFIYQDQINNLHIDIEIDESFATKDMKPIHHTLIENLSMDSARNDFFTEKKGWVVVRFAEKQVLNQRNHCCKVIAYIIYVLTGDDTYLNKFKDINFPDPIKQWTYAEAHRMLNEKLQTGSLKSWNRYVPLTEYGDKTQYRYSDWNKDIKLEPCTNPYTDYGLLSPPKNEE